MQLNKQELDNREEICNELNNLLKEYLTNSIVAIFGSTVTGLAANGSDMDVSILFDDYLEINKHKQQKKLIKSVTLKSETSSGNNSSEGASIEVDEEEGGEEEYLTETQFEEKYKNLLSLELEEQIKIVTKLIQRYSVDMQDIRKISSSRCPIIRFFHEKFKVNCDIALNNFLAVENTNLIKLLLELEPMLKSLVYVIRYWSKQKGLNGSTKFNSYTLIWMIVFYLQKLNYLPSIEFLVKLRDPSTQPLLVHGWNCSFEKDVEKIRNSFKSSKTEESNSFNTLLKGFFDFYSNFNFSANLVLSPRSGALESSEGSLISKKSVLNVQDPFDLEHNLAANVSDAILERFKTECSQANNILKYCLTPHKPANGGTGNAKCWGLSMLFTRKSPDLIAPKEHVNNCLENGIKIKLNLNNNNYDRSLIAVKETEFILHLLNSCLLFNVKKEEEINDENVEVKRKRIPVLNQICTKVDSMGLNCSPKRLRISDEPEKYAYMEEIQNQRDNLDNGSDEDEFKCHETTKILSAFNVSLSGNTWLGRRNTRRELLKQKDGVVEDLEFEKKVSVKLAEENSSKLNANCDNISFKLFVYLLNTYDEYFLNLKFKLVENDSIVNTSKINGNAAISQKIMNFTTIVHFLDTYLNNSYQKYFENFKK